MGLFDIRNAEKKFNTLLTPTTANGLLKRVEKSESHNYNAEYIVEKTKENPQIRNKIRNLRKSIDEILGSKGIVYLLSTRPHTTGSSNFVKLVKNKVVGNDELINYFKGENASYDPTAVRNSLMRYLKLTKRKEDDTDAATPEEQLARNKNKDVSEKMSSRRKVDRFKVVIVALLINLIDHMLNNPENRNKSTRSNFPRGCYKIFNVAVVSDDTSTEKTVIDNMCHVGSKLENFSGVEVLSSNEIEISEKRLPRTSILMPDKHVAFCFYDVTNTDIIKECPYAICPYKVDITVSYDEWIKRMTEFRDLVKGKNKMCDLRFLGVVNGEYTEEVGDYVTKTQQFACRGLDIYNYQQTVNTDWIYTSKFKEDCQRILGTFIEWDREMVFKQCMGKDFPKIICNEGMRPMLIK